jgi:pyruvate kinase
MGKPVIVATQMLDSLERGLQPTRAEVTDVHYAVELGADATMLSGETAQGDFPINAISVMSNIIETAERVYNHHRALNSVYGSSVIVKTKDGKLANMVAKELVAEDLEKDIKVRKAPSYLIVFSGSPEFVRALSATRLHKLIIVVTDKSSMIGSFGISYGVTSRLVDNIELGKSEREKVVARIKSEFPKNSDFSILYPENLKQSA